MRRKRIWQSFCNLQLGHERIWWCEIEKDDVNVNVSSSESSSDSDSSSSDSGSGNSCNEQEVNSTPKVDP
ncbi:hypothetical protein Hdeb2414_s0020g00565111 [Helianthus debilis subsp. tardiflorus]